MTAETIATGALQPGAFSGGELRWVRVADLDESPWNPRQFFPDKEMAELTESMRLSGFRPWLPLMSRPRDGGRYEVGAGHRRRRAALAAGIELVPCIVREMDDVEFLDVLNFDNCGREDVHPLHEAAGWNAWMQKTGKGVLDIAARIGQSKEYVYQRLKYSSLIEDGTKAFLDNRISAGHAVLIARLQPNDQKNALKFCEPPSYDPDRRPSVRELAGFIQRDVHLGMDRAAFDSTDAQLVPAAGACLICPKRTSNSPELAIDGSGDECTDPGCFNAKLSAHLVQIKRRLEAPGRQLLELSANYGKARKGLLSHDDWRKVPEDHANAVEALCVDGMYAGQIIHVEVIERPATTGGLAPSSDSHVKTGNMSWEEQAKVRKTARDRERGLRLNVLLAIHGKITAFLREDLRSFVSYVMSLGEIDGAAGLCRLYGLPCPDLDDDYEGTEQLKTALPALSDKDVARLAVELVVAGDLNEYAIDDHKEPLALHGLATRFGIDAAKIRREAEEVLKEAEGGTRREVEKPVVKKAAPAAKKVPGPKKAPAVAKKVKSAKKPATNKPLSSAKTKSVKK